MPINKENLLDEYTHRNKLFLGRFFGDIFSCLCPDILLCCYSFFLNTFMNFFWIDGDGANENNGSDIDTGNLNNWYRC